MELSKRLQAVADLVTEGASVADIGTDHGYIPIYLIEHNIAGKVIALDINRGPLERARMHVVGHGLKGCSFKNLLTLPISDCGCRIIVSKISTTGYPSVSQSCFMMIISF